MTRTLHLHIGLHKTGSTSIQRALHGFRDHDLWYGPFRRANHSLALVTLFSDDPASYVVHRRQGRGPDAVAAMRAGFEAELDAEFRRGGSTILSAEELSTKLSPEEIRRMVEVLARHYDRIRVIAYVRPYRNLMASGFQQRLQGGLAKFLPRVPAYRRRLEPWREAVGADNLTLRKFDRQCLREGDIVADFADWLGVSAEGLPRRADNTSLSAEGAAVLYLFNRAPGLPKAPARRTAMRQGLARALRGVGVHRLAFPEALMAREAAAMAGDIRWVEEVAGFSVSDPLPPDPRALEIGDGAALAALGRETIRHLRAAARGEDDIAPPEQARPVLRRLRKVGVIGPGSGRRGGGRKAQPADGAPG